MLLGNLQTWQPLAILAHETYDLNIEKQKCVFFFQAHFGLLTPTLFFVFRKRPGCFFLSHRPTRFVWSRRNHHRSLLESSNFDGKHLWINRWKIMLPAWRQLRWPFFFVAEKTHRNPEIHVRKLCCVSSAEPAVRRSRLTFKADFPSALFRVRCRNFLKEG